LTRRNERAREAHSFMQVARQRLDRKTVDSIYEAANAPA
jgi:hypothetical protein